MHVNVTLMGSSLQTGNQRQTLKPPVYSSVASQLADPVFNEQTSVVPRAKNSSCLSCLLLTSPKYTVLQKADFQSTGREELKSSDVFRDTFSWTVAESVSIYLALSK